MKVVFKCPYCGGDMKLREATYVYPNNKKAKDWGHVWVCEHFPKCDAYVGCHDGTTIPLGRPANARLRTLKKEAHKQFDPIWKSGLVSRDQAYQWLSSELGIPYEDCHIGMFDIHLCQKTIGICKTQNHPKILAYRRRKYGYEFREPPFSRGYNKKRY